MLERDTPREPVRDRQVGRCDEGGRVVLQPGEASGPVHPDAAQEPDLADRGADVRGQARPGRQNEQHLLGGCGQPGGDEHHRTGVPGSKDGPRQRVPDRAAPAGRSDDGIPPLPGRPSLAYQPRPDAGEPDLLARRGRGGGEEQVPGQSAGGRGPFLRRALHGGSPTGRENGGQRTHGEQRERRAHRHQQRHGDGEAQNPATRREDRHVHVVEHEHLVAQHRKAVKQVRPLLVGDRGHRCLETGHVALQRDGHLVPEPPLDSCADHTEEPGRRRGRG